MSESVQLAVERARAAHSVIEYWSQSRIDDLVAAVGWRCHLPANARALSEMAHLETGLGDPEHLYLLHRRRVLGTLRDLHGVTTVGVVEELPALGIQRLAKPLGVIAVASPATAPCSGVICNALMALKTRNAVVFSPNPRAQHVVRRTVEIMREAMTDVGAPADLLQCLERSGREQAEALMSAADRVVAAGGGGTVERAYRSGTPAVSAGVGNATVIVDETADLAEAAGKIAFGGGFNNGTSCSSESNVLVEASVADAFLAELRRNGAHICTADETERLRKLLWSPEGSLDRAWVGGSVATLAEGAGIEVERPRSTGVLVTPLDSVDLDDPLFGEKLSPVTALVTYRRYEEAVDAVERITDNCGRGHSCGVHTSRPDRVMSLAERVRLCRVMVNQSTGVGNSGSFDNGLPFTTTISSGSWGGCATSENISWRDFLNFTSVSRPIEPRIPSEREIFGGHWRPDAEETAGSVPQEAGHAGKV